MPNGVCFNLKCLHSSQSDIDPPNVDMQFVCRMLLACISVGTGPLVGVFAYVCVSLLTC